MFPTIFRREQTKTYGATRSGLVASLTKYRDEFELFLAGNNRLFSLAIVVLRETKQLKIYSGEYALENVLFLDAVDAFYNMCGKCKKNFLYYIFFL